jgi:Na+-transporting methylmalonyl-CoA/oxaloacetate decarboxylase gamma subunit
MSVLLIVPAIIVAVILFALIVAMRSAGRLRDRAVVPTVSEKVRTSSRESPESAEDEEMEKQIDETM